MKEDKEKRFSSYRFNVPPTVGEVVENKQPESEDERKKREAYVADLKKHFGLK